MSTEGLDLVPAPLPQRPAKKRTRPRVLLCAVGLVGLGAFFLFQRQGETQTRGQRGGGGPPAAVPVVTAPAKQGDIGDYVNALGYVTPVNTVTVRTRVDGQLLSINVREGQLVRSGETLAKIDPRLFKAQLDQAEGQYARDKALLDQARIDLERYKEAFTKHAIPGQQVDVQQATVYQDQGTLRVDQAQIDNAKVNLDYCTIRAPIGGRVGLRLVDPGNVVHAGDANGLLVIAQIQPISVVFSVAEDHLPRIAGQLRQRQRLAVDAMDRSEQKTLASGAVSALDNEIDASTGTVRLRAVFANQNGSLFPNQFVNARMLVATEHGVILIPTAAIQRNSEKAYVYIVKPDETVEMRTVTPGTSDGTVTAVAGVNAGENVVTDGFDKLQDGAKVTLQQKPGEGGGQQQPSGEKEAR